MSKQFAHGATFSIGGTEVGNLTSIALSGRSREEVDVTDHSSSGGEELLPGLRRGGAVELEGYLATGETGDAGLDALNDNYNADGDTAVEEMIITLNDDAGVSATTYTGDGFITALDIDLPHDGPAGFSCTVKFAEIPTKSKASSS